MAQTPEITPNDPAHCPASSCEACTPAVRDSCRTIILGQPAPVQLETLERQIHQRDITLAEGSSSQRSTQ